MADKLSVQQTNTLNNYLKKHPNVKREDAIKLLFDNSAKKQTDKGVKVEHNKSNKKQTITLKSGLSVDVAKGTSVDTKEGKITLSKTGRYSVTGKDGKVRYYAANGTELNEKYFKQIESSTGNVMVKNSKGVAVDVNKRLQNRIARASKELKDSEDNQGWLGKSWSGFKNMTGVGDSSNKVREQLKQESKLLKQFNQNPQNRAKIFKQLTGLEYNSKNMQDFIDGKIQLKSEQKLDGYKEGQKVAVDVASDVASGVAAFGIYTAAVAAAPFTGGASIAVGVAAASVAGAGIKVAVKASDTIGTNRKYDSLGSDILMGSVNGFIAPLTAGAGGAVAKTFAVRTGVQVVKEAGKQGTKQVISQTTKNAVKQGFARTFKANLKESVLQPNNYKLVGGTFGKRLAAYGAEGAVDGGLSGGAYSGVETAKNGGSVGEVLQATAIGLGMGALMGGAMTSLAHGKGVITGNKGAGEVLEDTVDTSLAPLGRGLGRGADDTAPTPKPQGVKTPKMSREELKASLQNGKKVVTQKDTFSESHINIPAGKMAADGLFFSETEEGFRNIVRHNINDFNSISQKQGDDFIQSAFNLLKKHMGLEGSPIKLQITNASENFADCNTATISIGRNWPNTGRAIFNRNWDDKSELIAAIAHEFNHMFQYKEMYINSKFGHSSINISKEFAAWVDKQSAMFQRHSQYYEDKAASYLNNFANYKDAPPIGSFDEYSRQLVEAESMKRGNIVGEEFEKLLQSSSNSASTRQLDSLEQEALRQLTHYFTTEYPNVESSVLKSVLDDAVETMQKPEFADYTIDEFVEYYINLLK